MEDVKFNLITYKPITVYSTKLSKYVTAKETAHIARIAPDVPAPAENLTIEEILKKLPKDVEKAKRSCIQLFNIDTFAVKEFVDMSKWNGCIFIDLDIQHSAMLYGNPQIKQILQKLYDIVVIKLAEDECFYYAERSSSGGFHFIFNYDVEHNRENFDKCAKHTRKIVYECGAEIKEWPQLLNSNTVNDKGEEGNGKVFDPIYTRPYQRVYLTGIDNMINYSHNGHISKETLDNIHIVDKEEQYKKDAKNTYKLNTFNPEGEYVTDHNERFRIFTALKRITPDEKTCQAAWEMLCTHFALYKNYTIEKFKNEFNYNSIDEHKARVEILKNYGITVDKNKLYYHLGKNEYMSDIIDSILSNLSDGINLLQAPTGSGKNHVWIKYNKDKVNNPMDANDKPILIVEPLNSIIETKYDEDVTVVTGSKTFPPICGYGMYVTNYNKLLKKTESGWTVKDNIKEFFSRFSYVVIDESHIIIKDSFRADVLTEFVRTIKEASKYTKIIMQTATPMDEKMLFDINREFIVSKKLDKNTKFIFRHFDWEKNESSKFRINDLVCLCDYYINLGRKVYIYWNNASLQMLKSFKATYRNPEKIAIFHKRNGKEQDMQYISENHMLGDEYDVLLSSVYFGVGNDLNDKTKSAVIIIGNNTWQEDLQAIGRWRNSDDVEICEIITDEKEYEFIEATANIDGNRYIEYDKYRMKYAKIWNDKRRRDKSLIIGQQSYAIKCPDDIHILAVMKSSETYYSGFNVKVKALTNEYYSINVKTDYTKPLECNEDYREKIKQYNKQIKNIRNVQIKNIIEGKPDYDTINKDTKLERLNRIWKFFKAHELNMLVPVNELMSISNADIFEAFIRHYKNALNLKVDYAELYAILWYRSQIINKTDEELKIESIVKGSKGAEYSVTLREMYMICAYIKWEWLRNKNENLSKTQYDYYKTFLYTCNKFASLPQSLIDKLLEKTTVKTTGYTETDFFFNDVAFENIGTTIEKLDIKDMISSLGPMDKNAAIICSIIEKCLKSVRKGRPEKPVTINGVTYSNSKEAQEKLNKSAAWVSKYKDK